MTKTNLKKVVLKREIKQFYKNTGSLFSLLLVMIVWVGITLPRMASIPENIPPTLFWESLSLNIMLMVGFITTFSLTAQAFLLEKRQKTIETILSTPLTLSDFWLGKALAVSLIATLTGFLTIFIMWLGSSLILHQTLTPQPLLLAYIFLVQPLLVFTMCSILSFLTLAFGMKENRIINLITFMLIFFLFGLAQAFAGKDTLISPLSLLITLLAILLLNSLLFYLLRFLSKERIITTLE